MQSQHFTTLQETFARDGAAETFDKLIATLRAERRLPQLFEALLMKKRHELGLPLEGTDSIRDIPDEHRSEVEDYYVDVCRTVGGLFLEGGDIVSAWPYFRAIDEPERVAQAIEAWKPPADSDAEARSDQLDAVIDIAYHQGAHPVRGYELILSHYGTCRAITTIEHQFPFKASVKEACGKLLIRQLYGELVSSLRADLERNGESPPPGADVRSLIEGRAWLFDNLGYHVDISHLQSCVRVAADLTDPEVIELAIQMCDYGRRLSRDFQLSERPPFADFYNDYRIFLRALVHEGVDGAVRYFTSQVERHEPDEDGNHYPAEVLVCLLHRVGRPRDAIDAYLRYLRHAPGPLTRAPGLIELCEKAGDHSALMDLAREKGDLLHFTLGLVKGGGGNPPAGRTPA